MNTKLWFLIRQLVLVAIVFALVFVFVSPALADDWYIGKIVGLCKGTHIYQGSGEGYGYQTIVPENNWAVKIIDGPRGDWWDTSRKAAGDPSGGTGWVKKSESESCKQPAPPPPQPQTPASPQLVNGVSLSKTQVYPGDRIDGSFTVRNNGGQDWRPLRLGIAVSGPSYLDFSWHQGLTIRPGDSYSFQGAIPNAPNVPGTYPVSVSWQDNSGNWRSLGGNSSFTIVRPSSPAVQPPVVQPPVVQPPVTQPPVVQPPAQPLQLLSDRCQETDSKTITCKAVGVVAGPSSDPYIGVFELPPGGASGRITDVHFRARLFPDLHGSGHCGSLSEFTDVRGQFHKPKEGFEFVQGCVHKIEIGQVFSWIDPEDPDLWELTYLKDSAKQESNAQANVLPNQLNPKPSYRPDLIEYALDCIPVIGGEKVNIMKRIGTVKDIKDLLTDPEKIPTLVKLSLNLVPGSEPVSCIFSIGQDMQFQFWLENTAASGLWWLEGDFEKFWPAYSQFMDSLPCPINFRYCP